MQLVNHNPAQFNAESELLQPLQRVVASIDQQIMRATLFKVLYFFVSRVAP